MYLFLFVPALVLLRRISRVCPLCREHLELQGLLETPDNQAPTENKDLLARGDPKVTPVPLDLLVLSDPPEHQAPAELTEQTAEMANQDRTEPLETLYVHHCLM